MRGLRERGAQQRARLSRAAPNVHPCPPRIALVSHVIGLATIILLTIVVVTTIVPAMRRGLRDELQQTRPFESLSVEVYLEILRTSQVAGRWVVEALRPSGLTPAQFNVLRILRGSRPKGLASSRVAERMINHDPDVTRLIDRLVAAGLVEKQRDERDRRVVNVAITKAGLTLTEQASKAVRLRLESEMDFLGERQLNALADLLEKVRTTQS